MRNNKVGMLLPKSVLYPSMSFDMVAGLKASLEAAGMGDAEVITENVGAGGNEKLLYSACEKMLIAGCRVVMAYINPMFAEKLAPLFESGNGILIALDAGYHYPVWQKKMSNVFTISLQGALGCRIISTRAMEDGYRKMAYVGSYYEAGYRSPYAFHKALEENSGETIGTFVTKLKRSEFTLDPLVQFLANGETQAVFASFCGDMLQDFCNGAAGEDSIKQIPVYGGTFVGEEQWLVKCPYPGMDIKVCVPWAADIENKENEQFKAALATNGQNINIFSLLGWEAAIVAVAALGCNNTREAIGRLEHFEFSGPRGKVKFDDTLHLSAAPMYDATVVKDDASGNCKLRLDGISPITEIQRSRQENDFRTVVGGFTSWYNSYGCLES